jgi:sialic acid synthase SpsE
VSTNSEFIIDAKPIGDQHPTYFIADIAANHDGSLERAKHLIKLAKEAGADAAKFQHFTAETIVSQYGFEHLEGVSTHQSNWTRSVDEVYRDATVPTSWTRELARECSLHEISFLSTPYHSAAVEELDPFVPAIKIGSGDIDWLDHLKHVAGKQKPTILATGAATWDEVTTAVNTILETNPLLAVLQCNTNYTGSDDNVKFTNLRVIETMRKAWPRLVLGLSDHTSDPEPVLGAVALGARIIERHFTDDTTREGPDHSFALDPPMWSDMVTRVRRLESAMGSNVKEVAENEEAARVVQRRCLRLRRDLNAGDIITGDDLEVLRPAPPDSIRPSEVTSVIGMRLACRVLKGQHLTRTQLET